MRNFVKAGLKDISISRKGLEWGIKVPNDEDHSVYVWVDALTNYISALEWPESSHLYDDFWPGDLHLIGKDIIRFHAVFWPAFLLSAGLDIPKQVFAHGFILNKGENMSKSLGNIEDPMALVFKDAMQSLLKKRSRIDINSRMTTMLETGIEKQHGKCNR